MKIPTSKQIEFLEWQIREHELEFARYLNTPMNQHLKAKSAFWGKIWGVEEKRGILVIQFRRGMAPRLKFPFCGIIYKGVPDKDPENWRFNYQEFRENFSQMVTDVNAIFYLNDPDPQHVYLGFRGIDFNFLETVNSFVKNGKHPSIVIAKKDPPIDYLLNLKKFISYFPEDKILNLAITKSLEDWNPEVVEQNLKSGKMFKDNLATTESLIIQGPPGSGKSTLAAEITDQFLNEGKTVCITSLSNKALMEIAEKPGISSHLDSGKVYKTNLTYDESNKLKNLLYAEDLKVGQGELLLATYYSLSKWYKDHPSQIEIQKPYDLIIIEEASQSFLATIAAFSYLARKVLIIGDPKQLPPIILNQNNADKIFPGIMKFAWGLESFAPNCSLPSFMLAFTFRLSPVTAGFTGIFYKGKLISKQEEKDRISVDSQFSKYLPVNHGVLFLTHDIIRQGSVPRDIFSFVGDFVRALFKEDKKLRVAILSPTKETVEALQDALYDMHQSHEDLTIETIDRVQGLTVDFSILVLTLTNPSFSLNLNRFNVATSRAERGTLIITDSKYTQYKSIHPHVTEYLNLCPRIELN
jgi:DNA polymerase III delta prime subunit